MCLLNLVSIYSDTFRPLCKVGDQVKVRRVYKCLFENTEKQDLVYAWFEDLDGYIIYEECGDGTQQRRKLTKTQFYDAYTRVW